MSRRAFTHFVMSTMAALQSEEGAESDHPNVEQESAPPHPAERAESVRRSCLPPERPQLDARGEVNATQQFAASPSEGGAERRPSEYEPEGVRALRHEHDGGAQSEEGVENSHLNVEPEGAPPHLDRAESVRQSCRFL